MYRQVMIDAHAMAAASSRLGAAFEPCAAVVVPDVSPGNSDIVTAAVDFFGRELERVLTAMTADGATLTRGLTEAGADFTQTERDGVAQVTALIGELER
jgi:hypothetical protein